MKWFRHLSALALAAAMTAVPAAASAQQSPGNPPMPAKGHAFISEDFEAADTLRRWPGRGVTAQGFGGGRAILLERAAGEAGSSTVVADLPAGSMRGCAVRGLARVRAEGVSAKPNPWNGIKFMLAIEAPDRKGWPQAPIETGTFDWKQAGFTARIPADATAVRLILGLEEVTGKAWFDDVQIVLVRPPRPRPAPGGGPIPLAHDLPRLRGAMVGPQIDEAGLRKLGREWNANLVRWQLIRHGRPGEPSSLEDYDAWLDGELERLDRALPHCEKYGLLVALDLHSPPGGKATVSGYVGSDDRLFSDRAVQDRFVATWRRMAGRYKDAKAIWGFDLANEPVEEFVGEGCDDWHD
jgi:endoglucanase